MRDGSGGEGKEPGQEPKIDYKKIFESARQEVEAERPADSPFAGSPMVMEMHRRANLAAVTQALEMAITQRGVSLPEDIGTDYLAECYTHATLEQGGLSIPRELLGDNAEKVREALEEIPKLVPDAHFEDVVTISLTDKKLTIDVKRQN